MKRKISTRSPPDLQGSEIKKPKITTKKISEAECSSKLTSDNKTFDEYLKDVDKKRKTFFTSDYKFNKKRVIHKSGPDEWNDDKECVLYWMSRDQRVQDNWAFIYAQKLALKFKTNLRVCFSLVPSFLDATIRHYGFMLTGLEEVEKECRSLNIGFHLLLGEAKTTIPEFVPRYNVGAVVTDFSPLRLPRQWILNLEASLPEDVSLWQVDAHNVVPVWEASPKMEYGARTIRSKINKKLDEFLTEYPPIIHHPSQTDLPDSVNWEAARASLKVDMTVKEVTEYWKPGSKEGHRNLWRFVNSTSLARFNTNRNDPTQPCLSNISPWIHFGQVAPQRCILEVRTQKKQAREGVDIFVEEALVRRELADNFCFYNPDYDNVKGAWQWAQTTLTQHASDKREWSYSLADLEAGRTHDRLWNAAQLQMVREGKMHGFLRMYWAKKLLEWTDGEDGVSGPSEALRRAIYLNDRWSIDGRDPNGYTGIMWSLCGVHDQGWKERSVFGKIRYMNYKGCQRKFNVAKFEGKYK